MLNTLRLAFMTRHQFFPACPPFVKTVYRILIIPSSLRCRQDQFAVYIFLAYCQLTAETLSEALKGGGGGGGEGELIYFKHF